jgi:hypothetical protein
LGRGFALIGASRGFSASAPYYGNLPRDESILDAACPLVTPFGGRAQRPGRRSRSRIRRAKRTAIWNDGVLTPHLLTDPQTGNWAHRLSIGCKPAPWRVVRFFSTEADDVAGRAYWFEA